MPNTKSANTRVSALMKEALSSLEKLKSTLESDQNTIAAEAVASEILRLRVINNTYLHDLAEAPVVVIEKKEKTKSNLEILKQEFATVWLEELPEYGWFSKEENQAIEDLIATLLTSYASVPEPIDVASFSLDYFIKPIRNFKLSDADWIVRSREVRTFIRHYRKFLAGVVRPFVRQEQEPRVVQLH